MQKKSSSKPIPGKSIKKSVITKLPKTLSSPNKLGQDISSMDQLANLSEKDRLAIVLNAMQQLIKGGEYWVQHTTCQMLLSSKDLKKLTCTKCGKIGTDALKFVRATTNCN